MFKSFLEWITSSIPVPNWIWIIWLFAMIVSIAFILNKFGKKENCNG